MVFKDVIVKQDATFERLFGEKWQIVSRINKIDEESLLSGIRLKVPMDLVLAQEHSFFEENWKFIEKLIYEYPFFPKELVQERKTQKLILVNLKEQFLGCYEYGELKFSCPISSARQNHSTPTGRYTIFYKSPYHISTFYGDPMPWTLGFTKYHAIHAGPLPGYPDSHGCVRLFYNDAKRVYYWANFGTVVLVVNSFEEL